MRKRIQKDENPRSEQRGSFKPNFRKSEEDKSTFKPRGENRFSDEKPTYKPRGENRFGGDKPRGENRYGGDKPRGENRYGGDKPRGENRFGGDKPRGENRYGGDKPRGENRYGGDKPRGENRFSGEKPAYKPRGENRFSSDKPERTEGKPVFEKRDPIKHFEEKKKQFRERAERKFGDSSERKFTGNREEGDSKRKYSSRDTFRSRNRHDETSGYTPNYRIDRFKENAPTKIQRRIAQQEKNSDTVRLNRFIANAGICSRRDADKLIASGEIKVNNKVVTEMGYQVGPTDVVRYGNRKLNREKPVYVLLNKPKDFITTTEDPNDRKTVMELVKNSGDARIYPVGRLDRNTTGLLLLTNDGELADRLTHPSNEIEKIYQAELDKPLTEEDFQKIVAGLKLEDGEIKVDDLARVTPDGYVVGVKLHSGKNRIVRRIFEHLGYEVTKLDRTTFAGLSKKDLPRGNWRYLTEREVIRLKYLV